MELLGRCNPKREGRVARMRERGVAPTFHAQPGLRGELHAAEVTVACVRGPWPFMQMDATRLSEPFGRGTR